MVDVSTIKPDVICISHGHGDHVADVVKIAKQSNAQVIGAYEVTEWLSKKGIDNSSLIWSILVFQQWLLDRQYK